MDGLRNAHLLMALQRAETSVIDVYMEELSVENFKMVFE